MTNPVRGANGQQPIYTANRQYYSGMKKAEAEKQKIYKKTVGIDFKDIDTDKNGILSNKEIIAARKKQTSRDKIWGYSELGIAAMEVGTALLTAETGVGAILFGTAGGAGISLGVYDLKRANKDQKLTEEYEHKFDRKM